METKVVKRMSLCVKYVPNKQKTLSYVPYYKSFRTQNDKRLLYPHYRLISILF